MLLSQLAVGSALVSQLCVVILDGVLQLALQPGFVGGHVGSPAFGSSPLYHALHICSCVHVPAARLTCQAGVPNVGQTGSQRSRSWSSQIMVDDQLQTRQTSGLWGCLCGSLALAGAFLRQHLPCLISGAVFNT